MLHDGAENGGLHMLPLAIALGDADEVGAQEHARDAVNVEQARGERRAFAFGLVAELDRVCLAKHGPARKELQGRRVRRRFGLDEHGNLLGVRGCSTSFKIRIVLHQKCVCSAAKSR